MLQELQQPGAANGGALQDAAEAATATHAASGQSLGEQISHNILHHISNGNTLQVPFLGEVELPRFAILGVDMSITRHVVMMWIVGLLLLLLFGISFRKRRLVPTGMANFLEIGVQFIHDEVAVKTLCARDAKRLTPYLLTLFFFILACNLLGLVPYASTATGNINVTGALAVCTLVMIQIEGIRRHGLIKHLKHMLPGGLPVYMFPVAILIFFIELFGFVLIKPFALM